MEFVDLPAVIKAKINWTPGCWVWTGYCTPGGYAQMIDDRGKHHTVTRWIYPQFKGVFDLSLDLDHLCRTRNCVNPTHLEPVTRQENLQRGLKYHNSNLCAQGHPFIRKPYTMARICLICKAKHQRNYLARKK